MKQYISNSVTSSGDVWEFRYQESDSFENLDNTNCSQCYAVAFINDQEFIIVKNGKQNTWGLVGGTIEPGETLAETLIREIAEESNMRILWHAPLGFQECYTNGVLQNKMQARFVCHIEPIGPFVSDPDDKITEIRTVTKDTYKEYFDWGATGEVIIEKAHRLIGERFSENN